MKEMALLEGLGVRDNQTHWLAGAFVGNMISEQSEISEAHNDLYAGRQCL